MSVFTSVTNAQLQHFLRAYSVGEIIAFEGIAAGIENSNYLLHATAGKFILTLFEHLTADQVDYFLQLKIHLHQQGQAVALPVAAVDGHYHDVLANKPAALIQFQQGTSPDRPTVQQLQAVGSELARLHLACAGYPAPPDANCRDLNWMRRCYQTFADKLTVSEQQFIDDELRYQQDWPKTLPKGLIHGDLFRDNCLMAADRVTAVLDWYAASEDSYLFDLAICANDWCNHADKEVSTNKLSIIYQAYDAVRPLSDEEKSAWPRALRRAALRFYLSRLADHYFPQPGELTQNKDPLEYRRILLSRQQT